MQTALNYATDAGYMERALHRMPLAAAAVSTLPSTPQEIARYVEQLLTSEE